MMKNARILAGLSALVLMLTWACAVFGEEAPRSVLLAQLPEDAQMIENIEFEDGDFIQTYQLSGGARVQLLRYADFDMTLEELVQSEWTGATDVSAVDISSISGNPASGVSLTYAEEGQEEVRATLVLVTAGQDSLVFQAVYPSSLGEEQISSVVQEMIDGMEVLGGAGAAMQEVG